MNLDAAIRAVQGALGVTVDGADGPATWQAIYQKVTGKPWVDPQSTVVNLDSNSPAFGTPLVDIVDERSEKNIATLLLAVQPYARALVHSSRAQGIIIKVTSGSRTYAEQDAIFAQGRTKEGKIVTKARGGQSNHNFGVAFDITIFDGVNPVWESPRYKVIGALGKRIGLKWGGDWTGIEDQPHFEYNPKGYTVVQMRERVSEGKSVLS